MAGIDSAETIYPAFGFANDVIQLGKQCAAGNDGSPFPPNASPPQTDFTPPPHPPDEPPPNTQPSPDDPPPTSPPTPPPPPLHPRVTMNGQNVIATVLPMAAKPISSYDDDYLLKLHPSSFPWGKGKRPKGMRPITYYRTLLRRVPMAQFGQNVALLFSMWDQWQRHEVFLHASTIVKGSPSTIALLNNLTEEEVKAALLVVGKSGSALSKAMAKLSFNSRAFLTLLRRLGSRIPGSPQAKLALRSKAFASSIVFGPSTMMINLCPAEIASKWVFQMGEPKAEYTFHQLTGEPDDNRLPKLEALRYIAKNYLSCEHFFRIYFEAFNEIFMGWPLGAKKQVNPNCIFGVLLSNMWSFEESGRRGIHGHATLTAPIFHANNLQKLCEVGGGMSRLLLHFAESLASAYMPSAYDGRMPEPDVSVLLI